VLSAKGPNRTRSGIDYSRHASLSEQSIPEAWQRLGVSDHLKITSKSYPDN
jgi:hypothetical protein